MSEMTAKEYLKTKARMTDDCYCECSNACSMTRAGLKYDDNCREFECKHPEEAVSIVEKWAVRHPVTRQSEFLKMFPNVERLPDGCIALCPHKLDLTFNLANCSTSRCGECKRGFWFAEVE